MSVTRTPGGRVIDRLLNAGHRWEEYDVQGIADECLIVLGVDPARAPTADLLAIAAKYRRDLRADAPCPSWCTEEDGHEYTADGMKDLRRGHRRLIGSSDSLGVEVTLCAEEFKPKDGPLTVEAPEVLVNLDQQDRTIGEVRRLAALLVDAAEAAAEALGQRQWTEDEL